MIRGRWWLAKIGQSLAPSCWSPSLWKRPNDKQISQWGCKCWPYLEGELIKFKNCASTVLSLVLVLVLEPSTFTCLYNILWDHLTRCERSQTSDRCLTQASSPHCNLIYTQTSIQTWRWIEIWIKLNSAEKISHYLYHPLWRLQWQSKVQFMLLFYSFLWISLLSSPCRCNGVNG